MTLEFGSMFSGIGGFDLALENAGMTCSWQCEIDPKASDVLKRHWPNVENLEDVKDVRLGTAKPVGLICGGFPCQDLSVAGKRAGLIGTRSGLFFEFARVIDEFAPGWVLIENVPGLLSSNEGKDFAIVIGGLTGVIPEVPENGWQNAGIAWGLPERYGIAWRILDAQYFGVAQRRRRVFIVGHLASRERSVGQKTLQNRQGISGLAAEVLFESEGMFGDTPTRGEAGEGSPASIEGNTDDDSRGTFTVRGGRGHGGKGYLGADRSALALSGQKQYIEPVFAFDANQDGTTIQEELSPTLTHKGDGRSAHGAYDKIGITSFIPGNSAESGSLGETEGLSVPVRGGGGGSIPAIAYNPVVAPAISSKWAKQAGGPAGDETQNLVFDTRQITSKEHSAQPSEISQPLNQTGEMSVFGPAWEMSHAGEVVRESGDLAPTLQQRMGTGGNQMPLIGVRRLTPVECERLQGFPDDRTEGQADSTRYRQLGNAVAVPVVEWIARRIMAVEASQPQ